MIVAAVLCKQTAKVRTLNKSKIPNCNYSRILKILKPHYINLFTQLKKFNITGADLFYGYMYSIL